MRKLLEDISGDFFKYNTSSAIEQMIEIGLVEREIIQNHWLGFPPVVQESIEAVERKLGIALPPSYKEFLMVSNGFRDICPFLNNLLPLEKIDWAKNTEEKQWFDLHEQHYDEISDEQYFVYGDNQRTEWCRDEYLKESLKISEWWDGMCVFLNPIVKYNEEWEVLVYATWYPGTARYRSFKEYLIETHNNNMQLISSQE